MSFFTYFGNFWTILQFWKFRQNLNPEASSKEKSLTYFYVQNGPLGQKNKNIGNFKVPWKVDNAKKAMGSRWSQGKHKDENSSFPYAMVWQNGENQTIYKQWCDKLSVPAGKNALVECLSWIFLKYFGISSENNI